MFGRALATVIVFGLAVGLLFPRADKATSQADPVEQAKEAGLTEAREERGESVSRGGGGGEVVLRRRDDGHFYADVLVNGNTIEFMVDTGASGIALTRRDAESLGLWWNDNELETVGRGVSGAVSGKMVKLDRLEIGNHEVRDAQAAIIPDGLDVSLLGQSVLSRFGEVKISGDEMVLR